MILLNPNVNFFAVGSILAYLIYNAQKIEMLVCFENVCEFLHIMRIVYLNFI